MNCEHKELIAEKLQIVEKAIEEMLKENPIPLPDSINYNELKNGVPIGRPLYPSSGCVCGVEWWSLTRLLLSFISARNSYKDEKKFNEVNQYIREYLDLYKFE